MELNGIMFNELQETECPKCHSVMAPTYRYVSSNNSIQARCSNCGAFIQNVKHKEKETTESEEEPTNKQIMFIRRYFASGQLPKSKKRASELIHIIQKVRDEYEL